MHPYLCLAIAIVSEVAATSALKASDGFHKLVPSLVVVIGYTLAFYFLSLTLKSMQIGVVYAIWSGAGIVLVSAVGWLVFSQKLSGVTLAGMALILAGVLIVNLSSSPH